METILQELWIDRMKFYGLWVLTILVMLFSFASRQVAYADESFGSFSDHPIKVRIYAKDDNGNYTTNPLEAYRKRNENGTYTIESNSSSQFYSNFRAIGNSRGREQYGEYYTPVITIDGHTVWCMDSHLAFPDGQEYTYRKISPTLAQQSGYWSMLWGWTSGSNYVRTYAELNYGAGNMSQYGKAPSYFKLSPTQFKGYYDAAYGGQVTGWFTPTTDAGYMDSSFKYKIEVPSPLKAFLDDGTELGTGTHWVSASKRFYYWAPKDYEGSHSYTVSTTIPKMSFWEYTPVNRSYQRLLYVYEEGEFSGGRLLVNFKKDTDTPIDPPNDVTPKEENSFLVIEKKDSITHKPLKGAKFKVRSSKGTTEILVTNAEGKAYSDYYDVSRGNVILTVEEIEAPPGYRISSASKQVILRSGETLERVSFENDPAEGKVKIVKTDGETGTKLSGAKFEVVNKATKEKLAEGFTNEHGEYTFTSDKHVEVEIREIQAPETYRLHGEVFSVTVIAGKTEEVHVSNVKKKARIAIQKHFDESLETGQRVPAVGVVFTIFESDGQTQVGTMTTNQEGYAESSDLTVGTYVIREQTPVGYQEAEDLTVILEEDGKVYKYEVENHVKKAFIKITKKDAETGKIIPVAGVVFDLYKEDQLTKLGTFTTDTTGMTTLPEAVRFGRYFLKEVQAPEGYVISDSWIEVVVDGKQAIITKEVENTPQKGQLIIRKTGRQLTGWKQNDVTGIVEPQFTEGFLAGTVWTLKAKTDLYAGDKVTKLYHAGDVVGTITTTKEGNDSFPLVAIGQYTLEETSVPAHYVRDLKIYDITFTHQDQTVQIDSQTHTVENQRKTVKFSFTKQFELSKLFTGTQNATFGLFLAEDYVENNVTLPKDSMISQVTVTAEAKMAEETTVVQPNKVEDKKEENTDVSETESTMLEKEDENKEETNKTEETDTTTTLSVQPTDTTSTLIRASGKFENILIDGKFYIKELTTGEQYVLDGTPHNFDYFVEHSNEENQVNDTQITITNNLKRGSLEIIKVELGSEDTEGHSTAVSGAEYRLVAVDDVKGETEIGRYTTDIDGRIVVHGLEHGTYYLQETKAPKGYLMDDTKIKFEISGNHLSTKTIQTTNEKEVELHTTATDKDTGKKEHDPNPVTTILDKVKYAGVVVGREYTVKGVLMNKETNQPIIQNGKEIVAEKTFIPEKRNGEVVLEFVVNSDLLRGKKTVVFETMFREDKQVGIHADIHDPEQTTEHNNPSIHTTATSEDGKKEVYAFGKEVTIIDTITYKDLIPGNTYTLKGKLMTEDGKALVVNHKEVVAEKTFTATESNGEEKIIFTFKPMGYMGKSTVVFEKLFSSKGEVIARHEDPTDKHQTVKFIYPIRPKEENPRIHTHAHVNGSKDITEGGKQVFTDDVDYYDLKVDKSYRQVAWLVDKTTNEPMMMNGKRIEATTTFTPKTPNGRVSVSILVDTTDWGERDVVFFEEIYDMDGNLVVEHKDITDEGQTIHVHKKPELPEKPKEEIKPKLPNTGTRDMIQLLGTSILVIVGLFLLVVESVYKHEK